jgi:hypothetical protein
MEDDFPRKTTYGEKYRPAMEITDQAEADAYFEKCVRHSMLCGNSREEAERNEKSNIGYYTGYYDEATMVRVQALFKCSHPIFGRAEPGKTVNPAAAFQAGMDAANARK